MKRRDFIELLGAAATWPLFLRVVWPGAAGAQIPADANQLGAVAQGQVGQVATLEGSATVVRSAGSPIPLQVSDPIFENDVLTTAANSTLGVTFDDQTTFSLSPNTRIVVSAFVYEEGGNANAANFSIAVGTAAFVASLVARTGDMKITMPNATLGIRGTTGVVDVPENAAAGEPHIKLYPDDDGHVGRIEVFDRQGARLGALTEGASAFAMRPGAGGRFVAVPFQIPPFEETRDRGMLQRLRASHAIGRRMTTERLRSRGPGRNRRNNFWQRLRHPFNRNPRGGGPRGQGNGRRRGQ